MYRPQENPANSLINGYAGDAVGILLDLMTGVVGFIASFVTYDQGVLKAALNVVVAD